LVSLSYKHWLRHVLSLSSVSIGWDIQQQNMVNFIVLQTRYLFADYYDASYAVSIKAGYPPHRNV